MKKFLVSFVAASAMALSAIAGDVRQLIVIPVDTLAVTNAAFNGMAVGDGATAHIDGFGIGACATATNIAIAIRITGSSYTNTITAFNAATVASSYTQMTAKPVVGTKDSIVVTLNATNTVPTYVYLDMQGK